MVAHGLIKARIICVTGTDFLNTSGQSTQLRFRRACESIRQFAGEDAVLVVKFCILGANTAEAVTRLLRATESFDVAVKFVRQATVACLQCLPPRAALDVQRPFLKRRLVEKDINANKPSAFFQRALPGLALPGVSMGARVS